jgi:tetratricopeptide (TPR) repeat protein
MIRIVFLSLIVFSVGIVNAQQERNHIRHGNKEYNKAIVDSLTTDTTRYQNAEVDYRKALEENPNHWDASYNLGNALYKQGKFEESTKQFQAVAGMAGENKEELAKAFHNLGNSYLQTNKLSEAIEAYKNSLRNNPNDFDTKYNLAWAQNKLQQQQQQDQDKQDDKDKDKDQENEDKQDQDKKDQEEKDQENKEKEQQQQQQQQQQQEQNPKENQISKEDAMRILEALQNDEKQVQEKVQKQKTQPKKGTTEKDW